MREKIKKKFIFFLIFGGCFFITQNIINKFNIIEQLSFIQENPEYIDTIKAVFNSIFSLIVANISIIIQIYIEKRKDNKKEIPFAVIKNKAVTCLRKSKRKNDMPEILLGRGNRFVYVISELKNVGEGTIEECSIAEQKLDITPISSNDTFGFCFRVCRNEKEDFKKKYNFNVKFKDSRERSYITKFELHISENRQTVDITINKTQRRKYLV